MNLPEFAIQVVIISTSGVLAPGPLFFTNLLYGSRVGLRSGVKMACGHTVVELPLIVLLAVGLYFSSFVLPGNTFTSGIGLAGGIGILVFVGIQIAGFFRKRNKSLVAAPTNKIQKISGGGPFIMGIILSALNPFFLIWWFTIGLKLIADSLAFGLIIGLAVLFLFHIWMDFAWLASTAHAASKGTSVLKSKYYSLLVVSLSAVLVYYGSYFIITGIAGFR